MKWGGRPRVPDRQAMEGILFVLRTGCQWNALSRTGICSSTTAFRRFQQWCRAGVFRRLWKASLQEYDELPDDPQIRHNEVFREVPVKRGRAVLVNHPNRYDGAVPPLRHLALEIGADSREVLGELGYRAEEIERLLASGAIHGPAADVMTPEADA